MVTSGSTDYARNNGSPGPKPIPKFTCGISADTCTARLITRMYSDLFVSNHIFVFAVCLTVFNMSRMTKQDSVKSCVEFSPGMVVRMTFES